MTTLKDDLKDIEKNLALEYNNSVDILVTSYLSRASTLVGKRIKDHYTAKDGGIDPREIEYSKKVMRELSSKHLRKEMKKGTVIGKTLLESCVNIYCFCTCTFNKAN